MPKTMATPKNGSQVAGERDAGHQTSGNVEGGGVDKRADDEWHKSSTRSLRASGARVNREPGSMNHGKSLASDRRRARQPLPPRCWSLAVGAAVRAQCDRLDAELRRIFQTHDYNAEQTFGPAVWLDGGPSYGVIERPTGMTSRSSATTPRPAPRGAGRCGAADAARARPLR